MPAPPLTWKPDEGGDVHLLRSGPESKRLVDALNLGPGQAASVTFVPSILGNSTDHGLEVSTDTGVVKAGPHPNPAFPRVNNFILTAVFADGAGNKAGQTEIRIHVHDSVQAIWLTPPTLSIYQGADECRFTVLARFNDECVGDITDWPALTLQSSEESVVKVLNGGVLQAAAADGSASITADLTLLSPSTSITSGAASVSAKPGWPQMAAAAKVEFVAGRVVPNMADPDSTQSDSVKSVVENAKNILFISEGFRDDQRFDYRNIVNTIARVMRGEEAAFAASFQPLNLLKDSFNFWTVSVPSVQDGITALGEYVFATLDRLIGVLILPFPPPTEDTADWNIWQLIHETEMPLQADGSRTLAELLADWQTLFGSHVTNEHIAKVFEKDNWKYGAFHSPLNERDTAFGIAHGQRTAAARDVGAQTDVLLSPRRTSAASVHNFVGNLSVAGFPIGGRWKDGGADAGLVCMICLCDHEGGVETRADQLFFVSTGANIQRLGLKKAPDSGLEIETGPVKTTRRHFLASVVAHELGHALGLTDEYGDHAGTSLTDGSDINPPWPNVQAKVVIAPPSGGPDPAPYDTTKIRWLWPRITGAGVLTAPLDESNVSGADIRVPLLKGHSKNFAVNDVVRFKMWPFQLDGRLDPVFQFFRVTVTENDAVRVVPVDVTAGSNATTDVAMSSFDSHGLLLDSFEATSKYCLIRPQRVAGAESKLVAGPILQQIATSKGPLNAPHGSVGAACAGAPDAPSIMTPTNLPALSRTPRTKADIVGIYEGGALHDCGVFRPAGRCRMRDQNVIATPFCHVCRFLLVDQLDPSKHGQLDQLYPEVSP